MGIWNSHTSVGNILGSLIAGVWVSSAWGLSFIVPGIIIAAVGIICFFFLVECEWCDPGCSANAKRNGAISLLTRPQAFLATPNTYFHLGASGAADPTATGLLSIRRAHPGRLSPCTARSSQPEFSRKDLGSPLGFYRGFSLPGSGYPEMQPSPGGCPAPRLSPAVCDAGGAGPAQALTGSPFPRQIPRTSAAAHLCIT